MYVVSKRVDWKDFSFSPPCTANTKQEANSTVAQPTEQRAPEKDVIKKKRIEDSDNQQCSYLGRNTKGDFSRLSSSC